MKGKIIKGRFNKKRLLTGLATTILFTTFTGFNGTHLQMLQPIIVSAESQIYTAADNLNIRSGPSTKYATLGKVKKGSNLNIIGDAANGWYNVVYNDKKGFVSSQYVKAASNSPSLVNSLYVLTADLNIRTGASVAYPILGVLKKGSTFSVQSKLSNGWYQINYNGQNGFINGTYTQLINNSDLVTMKVPSVLQNPELPAGCEVTSLNMALLYKGVNIDKITLAKKMPYTKTLDPNKGYVGSPFNGTGYTINPVALQVLAKVYRPNSADLTGTSIATIENEVRNGNPVLVWYTIGYGNVNLNHYKYQLEQKYWWPQPLHCIVVTGVSSTNFYINDPLNGNKNYPIDKTRFNKIYTDMGKRALVVR
jgi:uncharacterized protein YvpB/SH3-like domain-containing protein